MSQALHMGASQFLGSLQSNGATGSRAGPTGRGDKEEIRVRANTKQHGQAFLFK